MDELQRGINPSKYRLFGMYDQFWKAYEQNMKRGRSCVHLSIFSEEGDIVDQYLHQNRDNISLPKPFDKVHEKRETFLIAMRQKSWPA